MLNPSLAVTDVEESAPLQAEIERHPSPENGVPLAINPRCVAATCGAFAMVSLAAGAASLASRQGGVAETSSMGETVNLHETTGDQLKGLTIVLVATNAAYIEDHPTGVWLEELATPYYHFIGEGADVKIASPAGGPIPIDAASMAAGGVFTDNAKKFMSDGDAIGALGHSEVLADAVEDDYDALYFAGGHGACVDFPTKEVGDLIADAFKDGKIIAFDCHAPLALKEAKVDGKSIVDGKRVTGFSTSEEKAVQMTGLVKKTPEDILKELGGKYSKGKKDWTSHVAGDGNLFTGQNPQSSEALAELVCKALVA